MYIMQVQFSFLEKLEHWDQWLFTAINSRMTNVLFDSLMPYLRNSFFWTPLYFFLAAFALVNFRGRGLWWMVLFLCTVSLTDILSSQVFKEVFERLRPCQDPDFFENVRLLVNRCSGGYSFTSSHAANHFGMATYFFFTARHLIGRWAWIGFLWASAISYAQVYVGVHYPADILGGASIGILFGLVTGMFFNKRFGFATFGK